ncbi:hypothetical protein CHELA1G11_14344 [Hyphomicrobiales bacterium]|nr:hypothetical protein CHELA1G11_14344 [Hyphomicrobiales bacterium]CAH1680783.1 hypothetical protein CHELA1G2_14761 [Hyphomicrobiales bacterium]
MAVFCAASPGGQQGLTALREGHADFVQQLPLDRLLERPGVLRERPGQTTMAGSPDAHQEIEPLAVLLMASPSGLRPSGPKDHER